MLLFCVKWLPFNVHNVFFANVAGVGVVKAVAVKDVVADVAAVVVSDVVVASVVGVGVVEGKNWSMSTGSQSVRFCILSMCRSS